MGDNAVDYSGCVAVKPHAWQGFQRVIFTIWCMIHVKHACDVGIQLILLIALNLSIVFIPCSAVGYLFIVSVEFTCQFIVSDSSNVFDMFDMFDSSNVYILLVLVD